MYTSKDELKKWHEEQIKYFSDYLSSFEKNSREYNIIEKGIKDLSSVNL